MTPAEMFANIQAELEADETMTIEVGRERKRFYAMISSESEKRIAVGRANRTLKAAVVRALNNWNGDTESGNER